MRTLINRATNRLAIMAVVFLVSAVSRGLAAQEAQIDFRGMATRLVKLLALERDVSPKRIILEGGVSPVVLAEIQEKCELESLTIGVFPDAVPLTNKSLEKLAGFMSLTHLSVYASPTETLEWEIISKLTTLKHLDLSGEITLDEKSLSAFSELGNLESLVLDGEFASMDFTFLDELQKLRFLKLNAYGQDLNVANIVEHLQSLEKLDMNDRGGVSKEQLERISIKCGNDLKELWVVLGDAGALENLKLFPKLNRIVITWKRPTNVDFRFISENQMLTAVTMYNAVGETKEILEFAKSHRSLQRVVVSPELSTAHALFWQKDE